MNPLSLFKQGFSPKKLAIFVVIASFVAGLNYLFVYNRYRSLFGPPSPPINCTIRLDRTIVEALDLLKKRKDAQALAIFQEHLARDPSNLDALWGKAEVLRRQRKYNDAEAILTQVLNKDPGHAAALVSEASIRYKHEEYEEAGRLLQLVIDGDCPDEENLALAYTLLGAVNGRRSSVGGILDKFYFGTRVKKCFLKAKELAPQLAEVRMGLGTFYLLAPAIAGGNLDKAISELEYAVTLAPDFATANARLAQAYRKKGLKEKSVSLCALAKKLDPENEVVKDLEK